MTSTLSNPTYPIFLQLDISRVPLCEEKVRYAIDGNMKTNARKISKLVNLLFGLLSREVLGETESSRLGYPFYMKNIKTYVKDGETYLAT